MADLVITAADVRFISGNTSRAKEDVTGGETGTRGQGVYKDTADSNQYKLGDADAAASAILDGILMTDMVDEGVAVIAKKGATVDIGATTVAGTAYCLTSTDAGTANGTAGGFTAIGSLGTGDLPIVAFWGTGNTNVELVFEPSPIAIP